ncbi:MAG: kelch repeat-containing protein [Oceanicaulis sp.]
MTAMTTILSALLLAGAVQAAAPAPDETAQSDQPAASGFTLSGPWRAGPDLAHARSGLSAAVLDGRIYAAGGAGLTAPRDDFEVYEPETGRWSPRKPLPVGLERFAMATFADRVWVAGGYSSEAGAEPGVEVWSFSPEDNDWEPETALPGPKASFALIDLDGRLFALGGEDGAPGMFVFDPEDAAWTAVAAPAEINRRGAAAVASQGEIWMIGGAAAGDATARVDVYDPVTGVWRIGPALPEPRAGHAAAVIDGVIHVFGGRSADMRRTLSDHLALEDGAWTSKTAMPAARTEAAAATLDGEIWLIGGGAGAGFFAPFTAVESVDVIRPGR